MQSIKETLINFTNSLAKEVNTQIEKAIINYFGDYQNAESESKNCELRSFENNNKQEFWHKGKKIFTVDVVTESDNIIVKTIYG